ncbi:MAG: hypothetical protein AABX11_02040 [Nanoarchaeota archaeon]
MKKGLIVFAFAFCFIFLMGIVSAQVNNSTAPRIGDANLGEDLKGLKGELTNKSTYSNLTSGVKVVLNKDPDLPDWAEKISRVAFGFKDNQNVTLSNIILMLSYAIIMVFLIKGILDFSAFSEGTNFVISICLVVISSVTGMYTKLIMGLFKFVNGKVGMVLLTMILMMVVVFVLFGFFIRFVKPLKYAKDAAEAKAEGFEAGVNSELSKKSNESLAKAGKEFVDEGLNI